MKEAIHTFDTVRFGSTVANEIRDVVAPSARLRGEGVAYIAESVQVVC